MRRAAAPSPAIGPQPSAIFGQFDFGGEEGFTLLEMLVVLAITGLIAGLLFPQIGTASFAVRQRLAQEQLAAGAEGARAMALRSGATATLSADESGQALLIAGAGSRRITLDPAGRIRLAVRPAGIVFHPDGSTTGGEVVLGTGRDAARYAIDPATGQLRQIPRTGQSGG